MRRKKTLGAFETGTTVISTRLPQNVDDIIGKLAAVSLRSRSDIMRSLLISQLVSSGHLAPVSINDIPTSSLHEAVGA